jgi:hypothetical protein
MKKLEQPTVSDALNLLAKSTALSLGEYTLITKGQADIESYLRQHLRTFSTVIYGAFSRRTIVSPLQGSIVDMLIIFRDSDINSVPPSRVSTKLSEVLIEYFPEAYVLKNKNALMLPMNNFHYKIQPAYSVSENIYMLPDEIFDEWAKYNLASYNEIFAKENTRHKGRLIEIIRMIKTWNRVSGNLFNGYYLELLVTEALSKYQITSYSETIRHIFKTAFSEVVFQQHDPANLDFKVEGLNDIETVVSAMTLSKKSHHLANQAVIFEQADNTTDALNSWSKLFPNVFPRQVDIAVSKARSTGIKGADALRMLVKPK